MITNKVCCIMATVMLFFSSLSVAEVTVQKDTDEEGNTTLQIHFDNKEAKDIYHYLEYSQTLGGYIVADGGMSKSYLSSPAISCSKTDADVIDPKPAKDSPSLYACTMTIGTDALTHTP